MVLGKYDITREINGKISIMVMDCEERIEFEIQELEGKSEEEICKEYNVDSRIDAIEGIIEYWKYIA